jgi:chromosome partitioning protein
MKTLALIAQKGGTGKTTLALSLAVTAEQASLAAAKIADLVLIPCRPQIYDLETLPVTQELLALAGGKTTMVVLNAIPARGNRHEQAARAIKDLGLSVCSIAVGQRAAFGDAAALGLTVLEYEPNGKAASETRQVYQEISLLLDNAKSRKSA